MEFLHHLAGDTTFWVAFSSVICFIVVYRKAKAPLLDTLDRRTAAIRTRLDEAEDLYRAAEALLADYQSRHANAVSEADEILTAAQRRADALVAQAASDMEKAVAQQEASSRLRIQRAEQDVIEAIREAIVKAALSRVQAQLEQAGTAKTDTVAASLQAVSKSFH